MLALAACAVTYPVPATSQLAEVETASPAASEGFVPNAEELALGELLTRSPEQRRQSLTHSPVLARVARQKALDMARRGYFAHVDPDGVGTNTLLEEAGYLLPEFYDHSRAGNNVESLVRNYATAEAAWRRWMGSAAHRAHLLGLEPVFAEQNEFGIGYVRLRGNPPGHLWVVLIARRR